MTRLADQRAWDLATPAPPAAPLRLPATAIARVSPTNFDDALAAVRLMEGELSHERMLGRWAELFETFPDEPLAFRFLIRGLERAGRHGASLDLVRDQVACAAEPQEIQLAAECAGELRDQGTAGMLFEALLERAPGNPRVMAIYGKYLKTRGDLLRAYDILSAIHPVDLSPAAAALLDETDRAIAALEAVCPGISTSLPDPGRVLAAAIATFADRPEVPLGRHGIGRIALYTGSLGAGGAERQLTRIATALNNRRRAGTGIGGRLLGGEVEVIVNGLDTRANKDFFQPDLELAGVPVTTVRDLPRRDPADLAPLSDTLAAILPMVPSHPRFGLDRLVAHLRARRPEVLYFWQDGAVLTGALAALVAGVPRIAISLRGLPPNLRPHLLKPEYRDMYRALATVPGVMLSCNSAAAAAEYARWLDLPEATFSVLYNAHQPLTDTAAEDEASLWNGFDAATPDADMTIGGIFRFNANKRPEMWIACAAQALAARPGLRFVLVGDGELRDRAEQAARAAGIDGRVLFVGHSRTVGFWLSRMDVLLHLAENEGLPNVLIEAQAAGVPVIATPAGGSAETFVDGASGILLPSAEAPEIAEVLAAIDRIFLNRNRLARMGAVARRLAADRFDLDRVLARTLRFFAGETIRQCADVPTGGAARPAADFTGGAAEAYNLFAAS